MPKASKYFLIKIKKKLKQRKLIFNFYVYGIRRLIRFLNVIQIGLQEFFFGPFPQGSNKLLITRKESTYFGDGVATIRFSKHLDDEHFINSYNGAWEKVNSSWLKQSKVDIRLRAHICTWAAQQVKELDGDFLEFGTYYGILAMTMCNYISFEELPKKFYLFDTWGPLPGHHPSYSEEIFETVKERFSKFKNVEMVRGIVPESLAQVSIDKIAYMGIDMNGYLAERHVLDVLYPKVVPGGIIYLDDYGWGEHSLLRETVDDFFRNKPEELLHFPSGNSIVIKK